MTYDTSSRRSSHMVAVLALSALLLALAACHTATPTPTAAPATTAAPTSTPAPASNLKTYADPILGVSLKYPAAWQPAASGSARYQGPDGFFELSLLEGQGRSIDQVAAAEARREGLPYGSAPIIEAREMPGSAARLIFPSPDQPAEMKGQAALIVLMPTPLELDGVTCDHLVLWADQAHIRDLAATFAFVPRAT